MILNAVNPGYDIFSKVTNLSGVTREKIGVIFSHKGFNNSSFKLDKLKRFSALRSLIKPRNDMNHCKSRCPGVMCRVKPYDESKGSLSNAKDRYALYTEKHRENS